MTKSWQLQSTLLKACYNCYYLLLQKYSLFVYSSLESNKVTAHILTNSQHKLQQQKMNREYNRLILNKNRFCKTITSFQANFKTLDMYQAANQLKMSSRMNKRLLNDDKSIARNFCWLIATLLWLLSLLRSKKNNKRTWYA